MKKILKQILVALFGWQVRRLQSRNNFKIIAVVGSVGKTSTKFAIARMLSVGKRVRWQEGNYNDHLSVPLVFFDRQMPNILNPFAWFGILIKNEVILRRTYPYDVVVVELGTDGPGQITEFRKYLKVDIAVVTSIAPEHMEFFEDINAVADEELSVATFSETMIVNNDLVATKYVQKYTPSAVTVGSGDADYRVQTMELGEAASVTLYKNGASWLELRGNFYSKAEVYSLISAAVVSDKIGLDESQIKEGARALTSVPGRMQRLKGINGSLIIDDTYNASPDATIAALEVLYAQKSPHKIALLGNMNELGAFSEAEHIRVGKFCDPKQLNLVATLGPDANQHLAAAADQNGCNVKRFKTPYELGEFVKKILQQDSVVLAKGSQNNVYMEEAVKLLLADSRDAANLVRQSKPWQKIKAKNFKHG